MRTTTSCTSPVAAAVVLAAASALADGGEAVFSDEIDVEVVNLEGVVSDRHGNPVTGRGLGDFEVFADGQPVELSNLYAAEGGVSAASPAASIAAAGGELPTGATQGLNLVIFIDNLGIQPQNRKLLFEDLRRDLGQHLGPGSRVMLVTLGRRIQVAQHLTGDLDESWRDRLGDMTVAAALYGLEQNPLGIVLTPEAPKKKGKRFELRVLVQIPFRHLVMVSDGETYRADLSLLAVVRDEKGGLSPPRRFDLPIQIPNAAILQARQQAARHGKGGTSAALPTVRKASGKK